MPWRREWQPAPVFLPGESHGRRSLAGCSPRGRTDSDMSSRWSCRAPGPGSSSSGGPSLQPCLQEQAASRAEGPGGQHSTGEGGSVLEEQLEGLHATIQAWCCDRPRRAVLTPSKGSFRVDPCLCGFTLSFLH